MDNATVAWVTSTTTIQMTHRLNVASLRSIIKFYDRRFMFLKWQTTTSLLLRFEFLYCADHATLSHMDGSFLDFSQEMRT